ncbi:THAP domain-containing protein 11-like isoform X2 [Callorhinchus milii]|uniref:THAP domain-containing protein 11-like isoform X2 n=1 Tax=Callorhinchus milii TaxID=7868 RepID=UPI001C3F9CFD|nr:THAP domain-containing protein 11-like isoform X2 [Callorhinchus milii]
MVGTYCCVPGCYHNTLKHRALSFHNFPKAPALRQLWVSNIARSAGAEHPRWAPRAHHRVCDAHFRGGRKTYAVNVPTVFPARRRPGGGERERQQPQPRHGQTGSGRPGFTRISTFVSHRGNIQSNTVQHDHDYSAPDSKDDLLKLLKQKSHMIQLLHEQLETLRQDYGITKRELTKNKNKKWPISKSTHHHETDACGDVTTTTNYIL